ncbi:C40 family peptidase [Candidatus Saccharibacteria bacterium]|nr:C40 family peptidase [Candidatus Saccharibacteria bacterium]
MGRIASFCKWLDKQVANHSLYLWGGQGEFVEKDGLVDVNMVAVMEQTAETAKRVLDRLIDCYLAGYDMSKARFFDCSGLGVTYFLAKGYISHDTTADGLYKLCSVHPSFEKLKKGDMVFKSKTSKGTWGHVGYVSGVDENGALLVTEARGRSYGVVTRPLDVGGWIGTGRPDFWSKAA